MTEHREMNSNKRESTIVKLSQPIPLNMAESWHEIASLEHFWIIRRFQILQKVFAPLLKPDVVCCDIGCGQGLLQHELHRHWAICADGIDLDEDVLKNHPGPGTLYLYNILDRALELKEKYQILFLFDVLEHVEEPDAFLDACSYILQPEGHIIINVPASQSLYSAYDKAAGHLRRYSVDDLRTVINKVGLQDASHTYWGFPYIPLILLRKLLHRNGAGKDIIKRGFDVKKEYMNRILLLLGQLEYIPQQFFGSSIMMAARKV